MNGHYWLIDVLPDGKYSADEIVVGVRIIKESETNLRFMTEFYSPLGVGRKIVLDTREELESFISRISTPHYCFTKKAYKRFMS